jgi:integrase
MISRLPLALPVSVFRDDEPVIQSHPVLEGACPPLFGNTGCWDLNGIVRRAPNLAAAGFRVIFRELGPQWNLLAREMAMIWFNPRHPAVLARGLHLPPDPVAPHTVSQRIGHLRALHAYGVSRQLAPWVGDWSDDDFKTYIEHRCQQGEAASATGHVHVIKTLHRFRGTLASSGLARDPWPDRSTNAVVDHPTVPELKTPVIRPETWFPLVRAAWTYINDFGPDILRALDYWHRLQAEAHPLSTAEADTRFTAWVADPGNKVPVHQLTGRLTVNWQLLTFLIGFESRKMAFFTKQNRAGLARRATAERLVAEGRIRTSLIDGLREVTREDDSRGPWHDSLQPRELAIECLALRNACYVFVAALSMMRDCEIREITKDALTEYFGTPAVKSVKRKLDPDLPTAHWWIITPVAQAIETAMHLSMNDTLAFAGVTPRFHGNGFTSQTAITCFIKHVNRHRRITGLAEIPPSKVTPHMFRRTMAMLTRDYPGSEIAVGMQLKHAATRALANRWTQGYMDHDPSWARLLTTAIAERRFQRLRDLFDADSRGEAIGFGPGADQMRLAFAAVREKAEALRATGKAQRGDIRVEHGLLKRTHLSIRFGKLNHCTLDENNPVGAKCLEDAIVPPGHRGPLIDRCQPARCSNSIIAPEHLPIWQAEYASLTKLRSLPALPANRRALIDQQIRDVEVALTKAGES